MATRRALISAVITRTDYLEAAQLNGTPTQISMIEVGLIDAERDCYTAGLTDSDIWGQLDDTATQL